VEDKEALYIVSDGGVHHYHGNFAATIAATTLPLAHNHGKIYSIELYKSSYQLELYGMLAGVVMLQYIIKEESLQLPEDKKIELHCDNRSVVNKSENACNSAGLSIKRGQPDVDIEMQLVRSPTPTTQRREDYHINSPCLRPSRRKLQSKAEAGGRTEYIRG
jgi:hypothetical protein